MSSGRSRALVSHAELPLPIEVRPMRSARRLRLRLDDARGVLKLTCPAGASRKAVLAWAAQQREWVEEQLVRALPLEPFAPGAVIPLEGEDVRLDWQEADRRTPRLQGSCLVCGGPREGFARRIEEFLQRRALDILSRETAEFAAAAKVAARSIAVGDADTRWGSCSASGRVRYSWRLILAPPEVRRYVVAHEVAHLVHLNHGAAFKALERTLFGGDPSSAKALLRRVGPRLKRIGRRG